MFSVSKKQTGDVAYKPTWLVMLFAQSKTWRLSVTSKQKTRRRGLRQCRRARTQRRHGKSTRQQTNEQSTKATADGCSQRCCCCTRTAVRNMFIAPTFSFGSIADISLAPLAQSTPLIIDRVPFVLQNNNFQHLTWSFISTSPSCRWLTPPPPPPPPLAFAFAAAATSPLPRKPAVYLFAS